MGFHAEKGNQMNTNKVTLSSDDAIQAGDATPWLIPQKQVMEIFQISRCTLWEWDKKRILTPLKGISRRKVYLRQEVEELILDILNANGKQRFTAIQKGA
jgi:hypothetical protein